MVKEVIKYECPYCGEEYNDYDDAKECARDCVQVDDPDELDYIQCEMCNECYKQSYKAIECEESHEKKKDKHYCKYIDNKKRELLDKAASHPKQTKLK